ncbi:MAG: IS200/IS605 family element transposase accessory protein TnpB [Ardenticatenales bacterium]|nr:IS200/IS605 family element transposase accessory protein TnpB [Ardenticatenales bacterium]
MVESVTLVEQHLIRRTDARFALIDAAAFASKNLYNAATYLVRQAFIHQGRWLRWAPLYHLLKTHDAYQALPRKVSNLVLKQVDLAWKAYFAALEAWRQDPSQFLARPCLPGYKDKTQGRNLLQYDRQALSRVGLRQGLVQPSQLGITLETRQTQVQQVRIVPRKGYYMVEVVYEHDVQPAAVTPTLVASIDIGLSNLATLTSNKRGFQPLVVNGRPLKAMNQYYNQEKARLQAELPTGQRTSHRIRDLTANRNRKVRHYLHGASRLVIDHLVAEGIGTLVLGRNKQWKQAIALGRQTNQAFVAVPFAEFIQMLTYKAQLVGITVLLQEESYTSKCSFLDQEPIHKHDRYLGKRIQRGLFRAADGRLINADVNGSYNILKKAVPNAFADGIEGVAVHPRRVLPA